MKIMEGEKIAQKEISLLKEKIEAMSRPPSLAVVQVGKNDVSSAYVRKKREVAEIIGARFFFYEFPGDISTEDLEKEILSLKEDGIIVQLPLPLGIDSSKVLNAVPFKKDVDMLSDLSVGMFVSNSSIITPPVVGSVKRLFDEYGVPLKGMRVVVVGLGKLVGRPLFTYFLREKATVTSVSRSTKDISFFTANADIIVSGTGSPDVITGDMIKEGAVVIDAGSSSEKGKMKGDVHRESVEKKASLFAPVPGGVGPLTVCYLFHNLIKLYEL